MQNSVVHYFTVAQLPEIRLLPLHANVFGGTQLARMAWLCAECSRARDTGRSKPPGRPLHLQLRVHLGNCERGPILGDGGDTRA